MALAQPPRSVRNLSPGNLKAPTEEKGRSWWEGFVGLDKDGFARFEDAKSGIQALLQQIGIDKGRDLDLGQFIEKYVGKTADPKGTANALRNIPQILGVGLDTLLVEIPSDSLARAITQNEGGAAATDAFDIPDDTLDLDQETLAQELGGAVADPASDIPLVYRMDQREAKPSQVSEVDEYEFQGPHPSLDSYLNRPPLPLKDVFTSDEDKFIGPPLPEGSPPGFTKSDYPLEPYKPVVDSPPGFTKSDYPLADPDEVDPFVGPQVKGTDATEEVKPEAPYLPLGQVTDVQTQAEAEKPSFLSRIGGAIKNNPMVASQIAQVVGGIGSGVLGGRRMAKEQAKSARRQREAMNMANAISTLTRGRTQPAVAPRPVISKPGGAETIFDILGTLGQGGAQITQGIQQREEAAEDRSRAQEMEDFQKEYMMGELDVKRREVEGVIQDREAADAEAEAKRLMAEFEKNNEGLLEPKDRRDLVAYLDRLEEIFYKGDFTQTGYFSFDRSWGEGGEIQGDFDSVISLMFGAMNKLMRLGRMSDKDVELIKKALPDRNDAAGRVRGRIRGVKFALDTMTGTAAPGGKYANMSPAELADYLDENTDDQGEFAGDPEALKELEDREKNVSALSLGT